MPEIIYKNIRNGYARIDKDGKILISIPNKLKNNEAFKNTLLEKWAQLLVRYNKKTHMLTSDHESITLFGERVSLTDFYEQHNKKIPTLWTIHSTLYTNKILKEILQEYATPILDHYSQKLGIKYRKLTIRKTKSKRWSCTSDQNISLNLSLVHVSTKYIKYVIIHEICHLKIKNHSKKFWALVESFLPDHKQIRKELRKLILK